MAVSRRGFLASAVTGSALAAVSSSQVLSALTSAASAASPPGDVVGKITVGYQGWFACKGDSAPINAWWHWSLNNQQPPSPTNTTIVAWPDMREFTNKYPTAYANLGNGQPATLFSSYDQQTVDTHFRWMRENNIDTAALQRFNPNGSEGPTRDAMAQKVRTAAEANGVKWYVMYDVSDWTNFQSEIKTDWQNKMSAHVASPAYARQNGKPVVCIWGFGFDDPQRPFPPAPCLEVLNWFKNQGLYVIGGVPTYWRQGINDSRPGFADVYRAFNMISPWMVGRISTLQGSDDFYTNLTVPDQAECNARGIDYQPCVMPGDLTTRHRRHGDFMWRQFYNVIRAGCQGVYISMFDEFNEGNQIAKTAESAAWLPANSGMLALDEDGTACSADYYLRLTGDGGRMLKGQLALTAVRPTPPVLGGPPPEQNLALNKPTLASSTNPGYPSSAAVDGNTGTYWESQGNFPHWIQVDLGATTTVSRLVLKLPPPAAWQTRTQTLSVQGSTNGSTFTTLVNSAGYTFNPATGNTVTITVPSTATRYVRLNFTGNTGWPAAQLAEFEVYGTAAPGDTEPPAVPTGLTVTGKTTTSVSLSWNPSTDNVGVTGYSVRQAGAVVASVTGTTATVNGLNPATAYTFTVTAKDAAGNESQPSAPVTVTTDPAPQGNLARNKPTAESGHTQNYGSGNAVDGNADTYWESVNNAFPQWIQVDLGTAVAVGRIVLKLPPPSAWQTRTQTLSVQGSTNGSTFSTLVNSAGYTFNPATGNTVTITFAAATTRYVRLNFTANTGWPAGQLSEFEVYTS
ncbi:galactose-binding domain-containing protein [Acrocarpospora catenulata]|uniref:galactose-binding domain-containing protein n=1 Tax=Acrocarpospora catenulata TaxID=2836182 RepID=UPI001BDA2DF3|nr:discoidin domain-containing protein [Acrocarpospora catenulata]